MARIIFMTGAGISADSGIPTFRSAGGLWHDYSVDKVANMLTWKKNFTIVHEFFNARRAECKDVEPNAAHHMVKRLQDRFDAIVYTQNIDDLFEKAGCENVIHVHGRINDMSCTACGNVFEIGFGHWDETTDTCPKCASRKGVKPGPIFFHEVAPLYPSMWKALLSTTPDDLVIFIGTSGQVIDVAGIAETIRAKTVLSNLESDPSLPEHAFDHVVHGRAVDTASAIEAYVEGIFG